MSGKTLRRASVMSRRCTCTSSRLTLQKQEIGSCPLGHHGSQKLLFVRMSEVYKVVRFKRFKLRFVICVFGFMLLSVFDDVIISFRWICVLLPLLRRISQSEKTRSANVRPPQTWTAASVRGEQNSSSFTTLHTSVAAVTTVWWTVVWHKETL